MKKMKTCKRNKMLQTTVKITKEPSLPPTPALTPTSTKARKESVCSNNESDEEGYYNRLQRYSTLYRILLGKPYATETKLQQWNRIDLKLVNELGLTLTGVQKHKCWLEVGCRLLVEQGGQYKTCQDYDILCRPIQHDAWEFNTASDITGFCYNTEGDFEFMISAAAAAAATTHNGKLRCEDNMHCHDRQYQYATNRFYIQIYPTCKPQQSIQAFPLVIGPITVKQNISSLSLAPAPPQAFLSSKSLITNCHRRHSKTKSSRRKRNSHNSSIHGHDSSMNGHGNGSADIIEGWIQDVEKVCQDIYHAYCIRDNTFLIIKEKWELGTPGKMWDSALVLSQMFSDKIKSDPTRFKGHRILDLSAGTGCVGLLIALLYKNVYYQNRGNLPHIIMTDLPEALDLIRQNQSSNHLQDYTTIYSLTWGNFEDAQRILKDGPIQIIIASDVLYEPASFSKLVQTLDWLSEGEEDMDIYLGYKRRGLSGEDEQSFFDICAEKFDISILSVHIENKLMTDEGWIVGGTHSTIFKGTGVNIYQLVRKKNLSDI